MQSPRKREMCLRIPGAFRDRFKSCEPLIGDFMKINLLVPRNDLEA